MDQDATYFKPGFAHLRIESNADEIDYPDIANFQFRINLTKLEKLASYRPEVNAFRNFLGYLAIRLQWYKEALFQSTQVLGSDSKYLNALENLLVIYKQQGWVKQEKQIARKIDQLKGDMSTNNDRAKVIRARCLAEKGFVICKDTNHKHEDEFITARDMYSWALRDAGDLVPFKERVYWHFGRLTATQILYCKQTLWRNRNHLNPDRLFQLCRDFFSDSMEVLAHGDETIVADNWVKTALILYSFRKYEIYGLCLRPNECLPPYILDVYNEPNAATACYDKALKYQPNDPQILAKKAYRLISKIYRKRDFATAFYLLDMCINLDASTCNRIAFSYRAKVYLELYRDLQKSPEQHNLCHLRWKRTGSDDNWRLLIKAKYDFERSLEMHIEPGDCQLLGDTLCQLVKENIDESKKYYLQEMALEYYTIAKDIST